VIHLKGMTWDHTRGYDPMVATAEAFARSHPEVRIGWEERSLQAFADHPLEELAAEFDLIVIDHPHVGFAATEGCLVALDRVGRDAALRTLAAQSLGPSHGTYAYGGHQWALAIDAATQVAAYRPDLLEPREIPRTWSAVVELARGGRVLWPIKPVDALMSFFTLAANRGTPCETHGGSILIPHRDGVAVLSALAEVARRVPGECLSMNPIEVYERMVADDQYVYCPLGYGYTNYARDGYRSKLLRFTDIPPLGSAGPVGSCIGGTGIAVSAHCRHPEVAVEYAFWIASAECQRTLYFDAGGQPGNAVAWEDEQTNRMAHDFFRDTRATLDATYVRPRYPGYLEFQDRGGTVVNAFLAGNLTPDAAMQELQRLYAKSIQSP
jgi:multiple sugar transport system substrate-binding protein